MSNILDLGLSDGQYLDKLERVSGESLKAMSSFSMECLDRLDAGCDAFAELWSRNHSVAVILKSPAFVGCDQPLDPIAVLASNLPRRLLTEKTLPKPADPQNLFSRRPFDEMGRRTCPTHHAHIPRTHISSLRPPSFHKRARQFRPRRLREGNGHRTRYCRCAG
jgi:hypothetical protein